MKLGLKLYSVDVSLIPDAQELRKQDLFDFVELYIIPGSYDDTINNWKHFAVPFIIHAPHSFHGINFAQSNKWKTNQLNFHEACRFADTLDANVIIVHGGNNGSFNEMLRQLALLNDKRIALENKPKIGTHNEMCIGWSPDEFHQAIDSGVVNQTVLDFGHAVCAANSLNTNINNLIEKFMEFNPKVFHLSDGDAFSEKDDHLNLGKGSMRIDSFLSVITEKALVTIETPREPLRGLKDFVDDINYLKKLLLQKGLRLR